MALDLHDATTWDILLVDDERDNMDLLQDVLQYYGCRVICAASGADALTVLNDFTPNLILLDIGMPEMNGYDLRQMLRGMPHLADSPIVAVSAHAMVGDKEKMLKAGFDGYLSKPINIPTVIDDVRAAILENR